jgi:hypothetical protein
MTNGSPFGCAIEMDGALIAMATSSINVVKTITPLDRFIMLPPPPHKKALKNV